MVSFTMETVSGECGTGVGSGTGGMDRGPSGNHRVGATKRVIITYRNAKGS